MTMTAALSAREAPKKGHRPRTVAVASGKGGVGKTWFSITLAHALAAERKTLLFDGDLGLANVDVQLGLTTDRDLGQVMAGKLSLADAVAPAAAAGLDLIAGRSGSGTLANLAPARLNDLLPELATVAAGYEHVILDLGAGIDPTVRALAARADTTIVLTTDDPTALTDAYAFIKLTVARKPDADIRIVVNLVASASQGERTYATLRKACESFLGMAPPLLGTIRRDRLVRDAIRAQIPILTRSPNSDAAVDVGKIARSLAKRRPPPT